jgi:hypothetical protein
MYCLQVHRLFLEGRRLGINTFILTVGLSPSFPYCKMRMVKVHCTHEGNYHNEISLCY